MEDVVAKLLELAANNDADGFRELASENPSSVDETGTWYVHQKGSKMMVLENRTPLMIASTYGSVDVVKSILSHFKVDVKKSCGNDNTTALHCAASGGSTNAFVIVELLLAAGADPASVDKYGHRAFDVIVVPPNFQEIKHSLDRLLNLGKKVLSSTNPISNSPVNRNICSKSESTLSRNKSEPIPPVSSSHLEIRQEHPNSHPSLPDMRYGIYATDDFRMYRFKIVFCARSYSHDWTDCPFIHPGENARRRDPRKYHYTPVPCPEYRNGACDKGDKCQYSHGVFECWLHPDQYRTRICNDGVHCDRKVCFFAHTRRELRPLRVSRGTGVLSTIKYVASKNLLPGTSSYVPKVMSRPPFSPPVSPSVNNMGWQQPNGPALYRRISSVNGRDINISSPSKMENLFGMENSSSRAMFDSFQQQQSILSPHNYEKSPQSMDLISPMSLTASNLAQIEQRLQPFRSLSSRDFSSSSRDLSFSSRDFSSSSRNLSSSSRDLGFSSRDFSPRSRDLGSSSSTLGSSSLSWSSSQKPVWGESETYDFGKHKGSSSFENNGGDNWEEPDLSWVHEFVKDTAFDASDDGKGRSSVSAASATSLGKPIKVSYTDDPLHPAVLRELFGKLEKLDDDDSE